LAIFIFSGGAEEGAQWGNKNGIKNSLNIDALLALYRLIALKADRCVHFK
jgi:hypothetical protein